MVVILYNANIARKVQYLPWMYEHEFLMYSLKPQEINNYLTLFNPFGPFLWMCIALTALCLIFVLVITGETTSFTNIEFKGEVSYIILIHILCGIVFFRCYHATFPPLVSGCPRSFKQKPTKEDNTKYPHSLNHLFWIYIWINL